MKVLQWLRHSLTVTWHAQQTPLNSLLLLPIAKSTMNVYDEKTFLFSAVSRSDNAVESNILRYEWTAPADRSAASRKEEDCQRLGAQFIGKLTMGLHESFPRSRRKHFSFLFAFHWTRRLMEPLIIQHQSQHFFSALSLSTQVTDAHSDVQRTVDGDRTSSACLRYSDYDKNFCLGLCLFIILLINVRDKAR